MLPATRETTATARASEDRTIRMPLARSRRSFLPAAPRSVVRRVSSIDSTFEVARMWSTAPFRSTGCRPGRLISSTATARTAETPAPQSPTRPKNRSGNIEDVVPIVVMTPARPTRIPDPAWSDSPRPIWSVRAVSRMSRATSHRPRSLFARLTLPTMRITVEGSCVNVSEGKDSARREGGPPFSRLATRSMGEGDGP